jgi:hypothetical protein
VRHILRGEQRAGNPLPIGKAALIASAGGQRGYADWTNPDHRLRRLLSEFIGMAGLTFILSGGAAVLTRYGGHSLELWEKGLVLSVISGARADDRGGRRRRRRVCAARPGRRRGGHRRRGNAAAPRHREPGNARARVATPAHPRLTRMLRPLS